MEGDELAGLRLALVIVHHESEADDAAVFTGSVAGIGDALVVAERDGQRSFVVPRDWLPRVRRVDDEETRATLLGSDAVIFLPCAPSPDGVDESMLRAAGLHWPRKG